MIGIPLHDPSRIVSFETRARGGGIWSLGGLSVVDDRLFFATGNTFGASTWSDGEAVFHSEQICGAVKTSQTILRRRIGKCSTRKTKISEEAIRFLSMVPMKRAAQA